MNETYVRIKGKWCYLYRGIDNDGSPVDVRLSKTLDMEGTKAFFAQAIELHGDPPNKVATYGLASYPWAIFKELGKDVEYEVRACTKNPVEQSHRPVKHLYHSTLRYSEFNVAYRFCKAVDEVSNFLRPRNRMGEFVCLSDRRKKFIKGVNELEDIFQNA